MNSCVLCSSMPCCPEHCCNWDDCVCADCEACVKQNLIQPVKPKVVLDEPVRVILLNPKTGKAEMEIKTSRTRNGEESEKNGEKDSCAAGGSVFGIRYLRKSKK